MTAWVLLLALGADDFTKLAEADGVLLEARGVPGSAWQEYRVTTTAPGDAQVLCARAWGTGQMDAGEPHLKSRTVLFEGEDERVTWDQIVPPLVSHRDYVVRRVRTRDGRGGCRVDFFADTALAPPPKPGWVRIEVLKGSFAFTPLGDGRVRVVHTVHMEPGGLITPLVAEGARRDMAVAWVKRICRGS